MREQKLILLFGMPRSGTTWIGKIFDSHGDTFYLHEPDSVRPVANLPLVVGQKQTDLIKTPVKNWLAVNDEKVTASRPFFPKTYLNFWQYQLFLVSAYLSKISHRLNLPFFRKPIRVQSTPPVIVWKSIESLARIGGIQQASNAFSIQILRHPCGHIASTLRGEKQHKFDSSTPIFEDWDLFDKLLQQTGEQRFTLNNIKQMQPEERLAVRWGLLNDAALAQAKDGQSDVLVYEDVCREPKQTVQRLFASLGLSYTTATDDFISGSTEKEDEAYYATNKSPLVAAYKWQKELSLEQQQRIQRIVSQFDSYEYYRDDFNVQAEAG